MNWKSIFLLLLRTPCGENYEKVRKSVSKPPSLLSRVPENKRGKQLVVVYLNVGPGKSSKIKLHENDDPEELAKNYARIYHLDEDSEEQLKKLLAEQLDVYMRAKKK